MKYSSPCCWTADEPSHCFVTVTDPLFSARSSWHSFLVKLYRQNLWEENRPEQRESENNWRTGKTKTPAPPVVPLRRACAPSLGQVRRAAAWSCKTTPRVCSKRFPYKSNIKPCWRCSPSGPRSNTLNCDHVELSPPKSCVQLHWCV